MLSTSLGILHLLCISLFQYLRDYEISMRSVNMDSLRARIYRMRLLIYMMGSIVKRSKTLDVGKEILIKVKPANSILMLIT